MFKLLGSLLALYTVFAAIRGDVLAKSGPGARRISRQESPTYFWIVIAIYAGLSAALLTIL